MGKFAEGWERARVASEEREAERRRRAQAVADALDEVVKALGDDKDVMAQHNIVARMEHGALVMKKLAEPIAGVTYDLESRRFKIHRYTGGEGETEMDAGDVDECAMKLGAFAFSMQH